MQVPETEDEGSINSPEYREFCKLLLNGQEVANQTKKTYTFMWRGYKACISSQLPKLSASELERRYKLAISFIKKAQEDDEVRY